MSREGCHGQGSQKPLKGQCIGSGVSYLGYNLDQNPFTQSILSRILKIPNSVIFNSLIKGKVTPGNSGILDDVFLVNTDLNCVFKISLMDFLSVNIFLLLFSAEIPKSFCFLYP